MYYNNSRQAYSTSGLVVKSNVAIVGPRVRFSAGAVSPISFLVEKETYIVRYYLLFGALV